MTIISHANDEVLVNMYVSGCDEAFDVLLDRYKTRLYDYICFQLGQEKQHSHADDVFQETFVKAIVILKERRYSHEGHFLPWLTRIAHNLIVDIFRRENTNIMVSQDCDNDKMLKKAHIEESYLEAEIINQQTLEDLHRLMRHLPENQREVLHMRFYEELSFKEIADKTGVSINTSLGRMRYALINIRRMAETYGISLEML